MYVSKKDCGACITAREKTINVRIKMKRELKTACTRTGFLHPSMDWENEKP